MKHVLGRRKRSRNWPHSTLRRLLNVKARDLGTERIVKGGGLSLSQLVTCSVCRYVICMCYTSFALQQEKFRARRLRAPPAAAAAAAAPPHAVQREGACYVVVSKQQYWS
ncbi:hypothetical protein INR49_023034 [Caranx melampygus]|nr:hypothetical protein INR49_023034 [Caranx melampygus]